MRITRITNNETKEIRLQTGDYVTLTEKGTDCIGRIEHIFYEKRQCSVLWDDSITELVHIDELVKVG